MAPSKIIFRLLGVFLLFAVLTVVPYTITMVQQAGKIVQAQMQEHAMHQPETGDHDVHRDFSSHLLQHMVPYIFYTLVLAFVLTLFFMRSLLASLRNLERGAREIRDGNLDVRLPVLSRDELGTVTAAFNEMAESLMHKTRELSFKDTYIKTMVDPLWVVDCDNLIVDINPAFTRLFGFSRDEVIGVPVFDFLDHKNAAILRARLDEKRDSGDSSSYELMIRTKDGVAVPVLVSGSTIFDGDRVVGRIGIIKDFREQSSLRLELQQSLDYIEAVMDSIEDEIVVVDRNYRIVSANRAAAARTTRELIGQFCHSVLHQSDVPCWAAGHDCPAQIVFVTGQTFRVTHRHVEPSGDQRSYDVTASPVKDHQGNVLYVIELMRDVTERMLNDENVARRNRELLAINSISGILHRSLKAEEILTKVLDRLIEMLKMDGGGFFFIEENGKEMSCRYHRGISDEYINMIGRVRVGEDIPGRVAATGLAVTSSDISKDFRIERSVIRHSGIRGYCCVPLKGKEKIIGVFCLLSYTIHVFTPEEEHIMNSISEMTGLAIENIRLYEKMRELYEFQQRRRGEEHAQLISLSSRLGSSTELQDVMDAVLGLVREFYRADFAWLLLPEADGTLRLSSATPPLAPRTGAVYDAGTSSIEGYALKRRQPVTVSDLNGEPKFFLDPELAGRYYRSAISVPLYIGDKTVGVFSLYTLGSRVFKDEEVHFLTIVGNILAVSMERSDQYRRAIAVKELSDTILQSVADGIVTVDRRGAVISVNRAMERMIGTPAPRLVGSALCNMFRFDPVNDYLRQQLGLCLERALSGETMSVSGRLRTAFGNTLSVTVNSAPIFDLNGRPDGAVNLIRDTSREQEIDRMKTEIVRSVSHEFRTPLSAIVGMTEMILNGDIEQDRVVQYLQIIRSEGVRLANMVSELLDIARIESGKESLRLERIDLADLAAEVRDALIKSIEDRRAEFRCSAGTPVRFVADREKLKQVLLNLVDNALTFSDEACIIDVRGRTDGRTVSISVSDTGWGIPADELPRLTERFFRGTHGERTKGTGLGLALAHEIVKMHGGEMTFTSEPGAGTTVTVSLPVREDM